MPPRPILREMGQDPTVVVATDSTAAKGMTARLGAGRVRHLEAKYLWIQDYVHAGELKIMKIDTAKNRADMQTKPLDPQRHWQLVRHFPLRVPPTTGRSWTCSGIVLISIIAVADAERRVALWHAAEEDNGPTLCLRPSTVAAFIFGILVGFCTCFVGVWAARALCSGRRNKKERSSQTEVRRLHLWWEESHVTLKAEARARGLDSGLLKKELIRDLIMHDVYRA